MTINNWKHFTISQAYLYNTYISCNCYISLHVIVGEILHFKAEKQLKFMIFFISSTAVRLENFVISEFSWLCNGIDSTFLFKEKVKYYQISSEIVGYCEAVSMWAFFFLFPGNILCFEKVPEPWPVHAWTDCSTIFVMFTLQ